MSETATGLLQQLLLLPESERAALADRLLDSLSDTAYAELMSDAAEDPEFEAELARRLTEVDEHPERLLDGEQVMAELRDRVRRMGNQ